MPRQRLIHTWLILLLRGNLSTSINTNGDIFDNKTLFLFQSPNIYAKLLANYLTLSNKNKMFTKAPIKYHISHKREGFKKDLVKKNKPFQWGRQSQILGK